MHKLNWLALTVVAGVGCAHNAPRATPPATQLAPSKVVELPPACERGTRAAALPPLAEMSAADVAAKYGTGLDAYQRQDGVWLAGMPVIVNEDFDFATSMALDAIGAGIAARKRIDANAKSASELAGLRLAAGEAERLDALRACGVHVYGVIWTKGEVRELRVVTDVFGVEGGKHLLSEHGVEVRELDVRNPVGLLP